MNTQKEIWMVQTKRADFSGLSEKLGVSPVSVRIMRNRGMETEDDMRRYLYGTPEDFYSPHLMKNMDAAAALLKEKLMAAAGSGSSAITTSTASALPSFF